MNFLILIIFGLIPGTIWLLFFLRKDAHPEPKRMVLKIFFWGMLATLPIIAFWMLMVALGLSEAIFKFLSSSILIQVLYIFFGIALVEEFLKYLVVKDKVLSNPEFDEPIDAMLYMIIAALGFATLENILNFLSPEIFPLKIEEILSLAGFRFISATFLHALCSGTVGFFLALGFYETKKRTKFLIAGLSLATILHGLYDLAIMEMEERLAILIILLILIGLAIFVSFGFKRLQKLKSVCKIR